MAYHKAYYSILGQIAEKHFQWYIENGNATLIYVPQINCIYN